MSVFIEKRKKEKMSTGFSGEEVVVLQSSSNDRVLSFLNDLRVLLDKHGAKLYATDCELYLNNIGYVGQLEDNIETVEISDGDEVIFSSK
jgi:hypothetical protein